MPAQILPRATGRRSGRGRGGARGTAVMAGGRVRSRTGRRRAQTRAPRSRCRHESRRRPRLPAPTRLARCRGHEALCDRPLGRWSGRRGDDHDQGGVKCTLVDMGNGK